MSDKLYEEAQERDDCRDIAQVLPVLRRYAEECEHITEFGTRCCCSTAALLIAKPKRLVCYDLAKYRNLAKIRTSAKKLGVDFEFKWESTIDNEIEETDLLFIDTEHHYYQLRNELQQAPKVRKYIAMHDTETFGTSCMGLPGLQPAIDELLKMGEWKVKEHIRESNGLTILERIDDIHASNV